MNNYTVFLKNMKDSLSDDLPLYQNIYSNLKPVNLNNISFIFIRVILKITHI